MPLITIEVLKGVFPPEKKREIITRITDTMVKIEGEAMRGVTWMRLVETEHTHWAIGGNIPSAADVEAMARVHENAKATD